MKPGAGADGLHVAVIMDGNGRWAAQRGWPRLVGHRKGAERIRELVWACPDLGIRHLTLYAFSTENWKRSTEEVLGLMSMMHRYTRREAARLNAEGVRVRFIGKHDGLDPKLQTLFRWIETQTARNDRVHLNLAVNYGGRDEILRAAQALARQAAAGELDPDAIDESALGAALDTPHCPDPDLIVRTSGETRVSNFLLWQGAYSEYEFTETLWPDFTPAQMAAILERFKLRERRFGGVSK